MRDQQVFEIPTEDEIVLRNAQLYAFLPINMGENDVYFSERLTVAEHASRCDGSAVIDVPQSRLLGQLIAGQGVAGGRGVLDFGAE